MKLKRAMELANKAGARYALILGDDEIAAGVYTLKNMQSTEQHLVARDEIVSKLRTTETGDDAGPCASNIIGNRN